MSARRKVIVDRWWVGGEETCGFCLGVYAVQVERRCADCDEPMCPFCAVAVRARSVVVCTECRCSDGG